MNGYFNYKDELYHHGVMGMKWGVRRYQSYAENPKLSDKNARKKQKKIDRLANEKYHSKEYRKERKNYKYEDERYYNLLDRQRARSKVEAEKEINAKASSKYKDLLEKSVDRTMNGKKGQKLTANSWNETVDYMNKKIDNTEFNDQEEGRKRMQKAFDEKFNEVYKRNFIKEIKKDKYFKKAQKLADKYQMQKYDDLVKGNKEFFFGNASVRKGETK